MKGEFCDASWINMRILEEESEGPYLFYILKTWIYLKIGKIGLKQNTKLKLVQRCVSIIFCI